MGPVNNPVKKYSQVLLSIFRAINLPAKADPRRKANSSAIFRLIINIPFIPLPIYDFNIKIIVIKKQLVKIFLKSQISVLKVILNKYD